MPTAIQIITYKIHGQRKLLVPSIMLRRGYLATAHLGQIESEMQAIRGRYHQLHPYLEAEYRQLQSLPNYDKMTREERYRHRVSIRNDTKSFLDRTDPRLSHLEAMKKNIIQFKLN